MNAYQISNRVDFYCDVTRNGRYSLSDKEAAINDAIADIIDEITGPADRRDLDKNFQQIQFIRDSLYTLIKTNTPTATPGTAITNKYYTVTPIAYPVPTDYYTFVSLSVIIDSLTVYGRPTTFNKLGPLLRNSFKHPTNEKVYFNDSTAGITLYRGTGGTLGAATLTYIKTPTTVSLGTESQLINAGAGVLTVGLSYIVTSLYAVQNSVTYKAGDQFTAAVTTTLASGQVILASNTTTCDLPLMLHEKVARKASVILLKNIGAYPNAQAVQSNIQ